MQKKKYIRITTLPQTFNESIPGQLKFLSQYFEVIAVSSDRKEFYDVLIDQEVRGVRVNIERSISPLSDLTALVRLILLFIKEKPTVVHSHNPKAGTLAMIAAWITRVPYRIHTVAGLPLLVERGFKRHLLEVVEKITYSCANKIYPNSYGLKDIILDLKLVKPQKINVIANGSSNGINTSYFNPHKIMTSKSELRSKLGIGEDAFVFCFVGRIVKDKGINELVASFIKLYKERNNIVLLLVGRYEEKNPVNNITKENIINHNSIFHVGYQTDVRSFLSLSDTFVFPSYREGFPNVVMQAGAMGLPSIVTDINGSNEIIIDRVNGRIIPVQDEKSLFDMMKWFIDNYEFVQEASKLSRQLIVEKYDQIKFHKALIKDYKLLIEY